MCPSHRRRVAPRAPSAANHRLSLRNGISGVPGHLIAFNPNGITSLSPGLRRATPGKPWRRKAQPQRGCIQFHQRDSKPRRRDMLLRCRTCGVLDWCIGFLQLCRPSRDWERPKPRSPVSTLRTPSRPLQALHRRLRAAQKVDAALSGCLARRATVTIEEQMCC